MPRSTIESSIGQDERIGEAELAAAAFLARYQGRTLEAYRYDLRAFFQWAADEGLVVLSATRPQLELYVRAMEGRGLAATTIDRRLSTVCGFYRFAHIDGRIASNPAQYVRRPKVYPLTPAASTARSSAPFCSPPSGSTTPTPHLPCSSD
ncbi:MAG: site-specific integrase [Actinomycetota bacterium]|nr:site-specific integrase [Actinomycetota bacterium]